MSDFHHPDLEKAEALLRPLMTNSFRVVFTPDMPRRKGTVSSWFQVIFATGPGEPAMLRAQVHKLLPSMLNALAQVRLAVDADMISLRARRCCTETQQPDLRKPLMFIEAEWDGSAFRALRIRNDFSSWPDMLATYRNHFDANDPLTKQYSCT